MAGTVKKSSGKRAPSQADKLRKELQNLIKDIPEERLLFLIKQANTIIYNMKVEELNRASEKLRGSRTMAGQISSTESSTVSIEKGAMGKNLFLEINGTRKILDESELVKLIKIAQSASSQKDGTERLFRWLKRERDDIILDAELSQNHAAMKSLLKYLKTTFS